MEKAKIIKISVFSAVCLLQAFIIYSLIGYLTVWLKQPRFNAVVGNITTCSWGFLIQFFIFLFFFVLVSAAIVILAIKFFKKRSKQADKFL